MKAPKLRKGGEIRVIAPSRSLSAVREDIYDKAFLRLKDAGFAVTFSARSREIDDRSSSPISSRTEDLREAFLDDNVSAVVTAIGGFNVNQILEHIDYDAIRAHPKILCGYSDITALLNAVYARTGLVTYHGPHFCSFGFDAEAGYTFDSFLDCVMREDGFTLSPSKAAGEYRTVRPGECEGTIIGGNLCTLNLLQGTPFMPHARDAVLFLEDDNIMGDYFVYEFDRNFQSLLQAIGAGSVKGVVFGRFDESCRMDAGVIARMISDKLPEGIPVVFGADFGHVFPLATFPVGGRVRVAAGDEVKIEIISH